MVRLLFLCVTDLHRYGHGGSVATDMVQMVVLDIVIDFH